MLKHTLSITLIFLMVIVSLSYSDQPAFSKVPVALLDTLEKAGATETFPVIVRLTDFPEQDKLYEKIRAIPMPERREKGKALIKAQIKKHHGSILSWLGKHKEVAEFRSSWLANSVYMEAPKDVILELAKNSKVTNVIWNRDIQIIPQSAFQTAKQDALYNNASKDIGWGITHVKADKVWDMGITGKGVIIAGIDTGIRYTHQDFASHMWTNPGEIPDNGIDDDGNDFVDDYYGYDVRNNDSDPMDDCSSLWHGTFTAGIFAGDGTAGTQTGVAPDAQVMAVKALDNNGSGNPQNFLDGFQYAMDNGADVINLSLGFVQAAFSSDEGYQAVRNAFRDLLEIGMLMGVTVAVSAGNGQGDGSHYSIPYDIQCPADLPAPWYGSGGHTSTITVGNTNSSDQIHSYSSLGPTEWDNTIYNDYPYSPGDGLIKPDITAPGVGIKGCSGANNSGYQSGDGTSMSSPFVAGTAALMLSKNPDITPVQIDSILEATALELGESGKDNTYGAGRLRCSLAVASTPAPEEPDINYYAHTVDDPPPGTNDNDVLDPGETVEIVVTLKNTGSTAENVVAVLTEASSASITIISDSADYGTMTTLETKDNTATPFVIQAGPDIIAGAEVELTLEVSSDDGYSDDVSFDIRVAVCVRALANHENGYLQTSITNFGSIGYLDPKATPVSGNGFTINSSNYLFHGGFLLGLNSDKVIGGEYGNDSEWEPASGLESDTSAAPNAQVINCSYVAADELVVVDQTSYSFSDEADNDYLLIKYEISNCSSTDLSEIYCGLYCDWDLNYFRGSEGYEWFDQSEYKPSDGIVYTFDSDSPPELPKYVGMARIDTSDRGSVVRNDEYVYPNQPALGWVDSVKYNFLAGKFYQSNGLLNEDWSNIICKGPFDLASGEKVTFGCAVVSGDDYSSLLANATNARAMFDSVYETIEDQVVARKATQPILLSNIPNPFTKNTTIQYTLSKRTDLTIEITDLNGKTILVKELTNQEPGIHTFIWDGENGTGQRLNTGVYLCSVKTRNSQDQIRLLLIK